jgi:hypothetical protein
MSKQSQAGQIAENRLALDHFELTGGVCVCVRVCVCVWRRQAERVVDPERFSQELKVCNCMYRQV